MRQDNDTILHKAKSYGLLLLKYRPRAEKELRDKLREKGYSPEIIDTVADDFKRKRLLDDARFARLFCEYRMHTYKEGAKKIAYDLQSRGIDKNIIAETVAALEKKDTRTQYEAAYALAQKKMHDTMHDAASAYERKAKISTYLARKGYGYDLIAEVLKNILPA